MPLWLALLASSCAVYDEPDRRTLSITNGTIDDGDPAVVGLVAANSIYCTGTLVSSRVVLTAGHCIDEVLPQRVFFGRSIADGGTFVDVVERHPHPDFDRVDLSHDIGLVVLAAPAPAAVLPVAMRVTPMDSAFVGRALRIVGYGGTERSEDGDGIKREGTTALSSLDDTTFRFGPMPSQTCTGDSGGPAFDTTGPTEVLVGVTSTGDPACELYGLDTRVDSYARDFICPLLAELDQEAAMDCPLPETDSCCSASGDHQLAPLLLVLLGLCFRHRRPRMISC